MTGPAQDSSSVSLDEAPLPKDKLVLRRGSPPPHSSRPDEPATQSKLFSPDFKKGLLVAAIPALITLAGGTGFAIHKSVEDRTDKHSVSAEMLSDKILSNSAAIAAGLRKARKLLVNQGYQAAQPAMTQFDKVRSTWDVAEPRLRVQGRRIGGEALADLIYKRANKNLIVDRCGVVVERRDPTRGTSCFGPFGRLHREVNALTRRQDAHNAGVSPPTSMSAACSCHRISPRACGLRTHSLRA